MRTEVCTVEGDTFTSPVKGTRVLVKPRARLVALAGAVPKVELVSPTPDSPSAVEGVLVRIYSVAVDRAAYDRGEFYELELHILKDGDRAEKIVKLPWNPEDLKALYVVTETPDHVVPG